MMTTVKGFLLPICVSTTMFALSGCSSLMAHVAPYERYYPGTAHDIDMIGDDNHGWLMRSLLIVDLPFSAMLDTVLLPYDLYRASDTEGRSSPRKTISDSDKEKQNKGLMKGSGYTPPPQEKSSDKK
ncbi:MULTISPECIES: YceK/YidQ family lipoprotein [Limnobaculum]|nr:MULTISPECIES: YceK/YidQ family lipoprotein [Limnobaculum]